MIGRLDFSMNVKNYEKLLTLFVISAKNSTYMPGFAVFALFNVVSEHLRPLLQNCVVKGWFQDV